MDKKINLEDALGGLRLDQRFERVIDEIYEMRERAIGELSDSESDAQMRKMVGKVAAIDDILVMLKG